MSLRFDAFQRVAFALVVAAFATAVMFSAATSIVPIA
jgi:hypothetical protein